MLRLSAGNPRHRDGINRRTFSGSARRAVPGWASPAGAAPGGRRRREGEVADPLLPRRGPGAQDLWDMKPDAPEGVRGEFRPIATTVPGLLFCEHLPMLAKQAHHLTLVRSVHHTIGDHNAGAYYALTGRDPLAGGRLITAPSPDNFPPFGSVLAKLAPDGPEPARLRPHARLDEQQRLVPARPGRRVPGRAVRAVPGRRPEPARLQGAGPGAAPRAAARPRRPPPLAARRARAGRSSRRRPATGSTPTTARRSR